MSERKNSLIVKDMLTCIEHIQLYTNQLLFDEFSSNFMVTEACLYNIQVIGEAASRLPEEVRMNDPAIPWALIKSMRNRLVHEYFGTDLQVVWKVIEEELPLLKTQLMKIYSLLIENDK